MREARTWPAARGLGFRRDGTVPVPFQGLTCLGAGRIALSVKIGFKTSALPSPSENR